MAICTGLCADPSAQPELLVAKPTLASLGGRQRDLFVADPRQQQRALRIDRQPAALVRRQIRLFIDGVYRTRLHAGSAIDALNVIDIQHGLVAMKTGDRAGGDAVGEATALTFIGNDVRHELPRAGSYCAKTLSKCSTAGRSEKNGPARSRNNVKSGV